MANWAFTDYAIEGPKETLLKIYKAIHNPDKSEGDEGWEGGVLKALGLTWESNKPDGTGKYMRGFIQDVENIEFNPEEDSALQFYAQEAWGATDFNEVLEENFPDIKVFYKVEEEGEEVFATNDKEGKYFPERYYVDTCINGNYESEYFTYESSVYKWLHDITDGRVKCEQDVEDFNEEQEDSDNINEDYINIYTFNIIK